MISPIERFGGARRLPIVAATCWWCRCLLPLRLRRRNIIPTGAFAPFADCRSEQCGRRRVRTYSQYHQRRIHCRQGKKRYPISKTVTLQGGTIENPETGALTFVGAEDGNTLSNTALPVPGGLLGVVGARIPARTVRRSSNEIVEHGPTGVTATAELAGPASAIELNKLNLFFGEGTALSLPLKIKLSNPFLGEDCYIGSDERPGNDRPHDGLNKSARVQTNRSKAIPANWKRGRRRDCASSRTTRL